MGTILVGTCSWADPTLVKETDWYPKSAKSPEDRLRYYSEQFPIVEIDSLYYALPSEEAAFNWAERTPEAFVFDAKAFRLLTAHPTQPKSLPRDIREALPPKLAEKRHVYLHEMPEALTSEVWQRFRLGLEPLRQAGKLGAILLQFPRWFFPSHESREQILQAREALPDARLAVEFRHNSWVNDKNRQRTLDFLSDNRMSFVCVDEPELKDTLPPFVAVTNPELAMVRFHGRDPEAWSSKTASPAARFRYLYSEPELKEWLPRLEELAGQTQETHALLNNCFRDHAVVNAQQLRELVQRKERE